MDHLYYFKKTIKKKVQFQGCITYPVYNYQTRPQTKLYSFLRSNKAHYSNECSDAQNFHHCNNKDGLYVSDFDFDIPCEEPSPTWTSLRI